jgi:UDP-glucuronate 4-epimerase
MPGPVLVTGAAGFIGSHLVDELTEHGESVVMIDNLNSFYSPDLKAANVARSLRSPLAKFYHVDLADEQELDAIFANERPVSIVHLAASAGVRKSILYPQEYVRNNVAALVVLLEVASAHRIRKLVFASSSSVYGGVSAIPYLEDGPVDPISPYAVTKLAGEQLVRIYAQRCGFDCVNLRLFSVYGPRQRPDMVMSKFSSLIAEGKPLPVNGSLELARDYTYVDDVVRAIHAALSRHTCNATLNIGRSSAVSLDEVIQTLSNGLGREVSLDIGPFVDAEPKVTCADVSAARRLLGYEPRTDFCSGMNHFLDWFLEQRTPQLATT